MTRLFAWLAGTFLAFVLAAGVLFIALLDDRPLVERGENISPLAINQARWLFNTNDPRRFRQGEVRTTAIPVTLLDEGLNALASRSLKGRGALIVGEEKAEIRITRRIDLLAGDRYLNVRAIIQEGQGEPRIVAATIGSHSIPPFLVYAMLNTGIRMAGHGREWALARQAIRQLDFDPGRRRVVISYAWEPSLLDHARAIAFSPQELVHIRSAQESLAAMLDHYAPGRRIPLATVLRATLDIGGSDQRENRRAVLLALGIHLGEKNIASLIPEAANWPQLRPVTMVLAGRNDSAQHFVVSAMLAAWAGEPVADAIGLYKELADARLGSGFSFADLAADRAGTRFGELINRGSPRIDATLRDELTDRDLIPNLSDLPEYISASDFQRRFGSTSSPSYRELTAEIERRLDAMPLYKPE